MSVSLGVYDWEREKPQEIVVQLLLEYDPGNAPETDSLADTVDYAAVEQAVVKVGKSRHFNLLESIISEMGRAALGFSGVRRATVAATKSGVMQYAENVTVKETFTA